MKMLSIHPQNPQPRLIDQVVASLNNNELIAYDSELGFGLACRLGNNRGIDTLKPFFGDGNPATLLCQHLSQLSQYALIDDTQYRHIKAHLDSNHRFILMAQKPTPKALMHSKNKTISTAFAHTPISNALIDAINEPLVVIAITNTDPTIDLQQLPKTIVLAINSDNADYRPKSPLIDLTQPF